MPSAARASAGGPTFKLEVLTESSLRALITFHGTSPSGASSAWLVHTAAKCHRPTHRFEEHRVLLHLLALTSSLTSMLHRLRRLINP